MAVIYFTTVYSVLLTYSRFGLCHGFSVTVSVLFCMWYVQGKKDCQIKITNILTINITNKYNKAKIQLLYSCCLCF